MRPNTEAIEALMEAHGLSLTDLRNETGLSLSYLSEIRNGDKTNVSAPVMKKLADALNCKIRAIAMPRGEVVA